MKKWKIAIMGCGMIAQDIYIPQIKKMPKAELAAVCDINAARAKECAEKFAIPQWYSDYDELLEKCEFDILMDIASIPAHHEINMKAAESRKTSLFTKTGRAVCRTGYRTDRGSEGSACEIFSLSDSSSSARH